MPTSPPSAKLLVSLDGGPTATGKITAAFGQVVTLTAQSTAGWNAALWEIYDSPYASAPSGWSTSTPGVYFFQPPNPTTPPPAFTLPSSGGNNWGKFKLRLRINGNPLALNADGTPNTAYKPGYTDESTFLSVLSPVLGMEGIGLGDIDWAKTQMGIARASDRTASGVTITGTGVLKASGGSLGGAAYIGAADTILATNTGGTDTTFVAPGGDVSFAAGNFTLVNLRGRPVSASAPSSGQSLVWNGSAWAPGAAGVGVTGTGLVRVAGGTLGGAGSVGGAGQGLFTKADTSDVVWAGMSGDAALSPSTPGAVTVSGLQGRQVDTAAPGTGQVLAWNGSKWAPAPPGNVTVSGSGILRAASGSLSPTAYVGTNGQALFTNGAGSDSTWAGFSGDATLSASTPGQVTVTALRGRAIAAGAPSAQQVMVWDSVGNAWTPTSLGAAQLPNLAGDTTGATNATTVAKLRGVPVSTTAPTTGQVLTYDGTQWSGAPGGGSTTCTGFTMPAVLGTTTTTIGTSMNLQVGQVLAVAGGGFMVVTAIAGGGLNLTIQNGGSSVNASPGTVIASGTVVSVAGLDAPMGAATAEAQALVKVSGQYVAKGQRPVYQARALGARCDGSDSWQAIQRTIALATHAVDQKEVRLEAGAETWAGATGTYLISKPLFLYRQDSSGTDNVRLAGAPNSGTLGKCTIREPHNGETSFPYWEGPKFVVGGSVDEPSFASRQFNGTGSAINYVTFVAAPFTLEQHHFINLSEAASGTGYLGGLTNANIRFFFRFATGPASSDAITQFYCGWQNTTVGNNELTLVVQIANVGGTLYWHLIVTSAVGGQKAGSSDGTGVNPLLTPAPNVDHYVEWNYQSGTSRSCTASSVTSQITLSGHGYNSGDAVNFGGTPPSPLVAGTDYYVVSPTTNTFQVSATRGGSAITLTTNGTSVTVNRDYAQLFVTPAGGSTVEAVRLQVSGALVQNSPFSQFIMGYSTYNDYPAEGGTVSAWVDGCQYGSVQLSQRSRQSSLVGYTVPTAEHAISSSDTTTALLLNFGSANRSITRTADAGSADPGGFLGWIVGQCNVSDAYQARTPAGNDVWIHWKGTDHGVTQNTAIENIRVGETGIGIYVFASTYTTIKACAVSASIIGIVWSAFSYGSLSVGNTVQVLNAYSYGPRSLINACEVIVGTEMVTIQGADNIYPVYAGGTWAIIVGVICNLTIRDAYIKPNTALHRGTIFSYSAYQIDASNIHLYDEGGSLNVNAAIVLFETGSSYFRGAFTASNPNCTLAQIISGLAATQARFVFEGSAGNWLTLFSLGTDGEGSPTVETDFSDAPFDGNPCQMYAPTNPVHVVDPARQTEARVIGVHTNPGTLSWDIFRYGTHVFVDAGVGGALTVIYPICAGAIPAGRAGVSNGVDTVGGYGIGVERTIVITTQDVTVGTGSTQCYLGTINVHNGSAAITGNGTAFTWSNWAGQTITILGVSYTILSITNDTNMTLTANYTGTSQNFVTYFQTGKTVTLTVASGKTRQKIHTLNGTDWLPCAPAI